MSRLQPEYREWADDTLNRAQQEMEDRARDEMERNVATFVDWVTSIREASDLAPIVGYAMRSDPFALGQMLAQLERDYRDYRIELAHTQGEWTQVCREIEAGTEEDVDEAA